MTIKDVLAQKSPSVWSISPDATVFDAVTRMAEKDVGSLVVMDDDKLIGIVTERHYARNVILKGKTSPEEAGVAGEISEQPIGSYSYQKIMNNGNATRCSVQVFALRVTRQHKRWPEKHERKIKWYGPDDAVRFVHEPYLRRIIRKFKPQKKVS